MLKQVCPHKHIKRFAHYQIQASKCSNCKSSHSFKSASQRGYWYKNIIHIQTSQFVSFWPFGRNDVLISALHRCKVNIALFVWWVKTTTWYVFNLAFFLLRSGFDHEKYINCVLGLYHCNILYLQNSADACAVTLCWVWVKRREKQIRKSKREEAVQCYSERCMEDN